MSFANNLKQLRKSKGFNQKDIALKLGISRQAYSNYEMGSREPNIEILRSISKLFDISVDRLIVPENDKCAKNVSSEIPIANTTFPCNLRTLRKKAKITQTELAKCVNVAESTISNYETGCREPDLTTLSKIADVLDTSVDRLLGREEHYTSKNMSISNHLSLTEEEKVLIEIYREINERKKFEVIASLINAQKNQDE